MDNYIQEAIKTESLSPSFEHPRLLHAAIGISTEAAELFIAASTNDEVNAREEIGDLFWYLAVICDELKVTFAELAFLAPSQSDNWPKEFSEATSGLLDHMKKVCFYSKEFDEAHFGTLAGTVIRLLKELCEKEKWDLNELLETNIKKLRLRYGEKFDADAAENRDLDAEREVLENA